MLRSRVAVVQPFIVPGGGTEAVTAWTIEALKDDHQVALFTYSSIGADTLNRFYGTNLLPSEFSVIQPSLPPFLSRTGRLTQLKDHLMMRYCKSLRADFDLFISIGGGMDFGQAAVQYFAFAPDSILVKIISHDPRLPKPYQVFKQGIMRVCEKLSGYSQDSMNRNVSLVTSELIGKTVEEIYAIHDYEIVLPPVSAPPNNKPWEGRQDSFLCIARIVPEKRIEHAIEALRQVREKGFDVTLRIVGRRDDLNYYRRIQRMCRENCSWVNLYDVMPKDELFQLMGQCKYGINAAPGEPSGVAALEMIKSGCIVFVAGGGGLSDILNATEVTFNGVDEAVEKITAVLGKASLQQHLLNKLEHTGDSLSTDAFCQTIQRVVADALAVPEAGRPA